MIGGPRCYKQPLPDGWDSETPEEREARTSRKLNLAFLELSVCHESLKRLIGIIKGIDDNDIVDSILEPLFEAENHLMTAFNKLDKY